MAAVGLVVRSLLRRRIAATVALILLVALASGAVLTAAAGARRTSTAFDRLLDETDASDVVIIGTGDLSTADLEQLPGVERASEAVGLTVAVDGPDGVPDMDNSPGASASVDAGARFERDRPLVLEGRLAEPDR